MNNALKKALFALLGGFTALTIFSGVSFADGTEGVSQCQVIYGGGQICEEVVKFTIDKKVHNGSAFVDNLGINDTKFAPNTEVTFRIVVKNTGDRTIERLDVADILPQHLTFVSGAGNYNQDTRTIAYRVDNLAPGASHEYTFVARTTSSEQLPQDKGIVCVVNKSRAVESKGSTAEDTSEICIQKPSVGQPTSPEKGGSKVFDTPNVKQIPETGPGLALLAALIPSGIAGVILRKKAK